MPTDNIDFLLQLKKKIRSARDTSNRLKGSLDAKMELLKEKYGCSSIDAAQKRLEVWREKRTSLIAEAEKRVAEIQEKYYA